MAVSNINTIINNDIQKVWNIVLAVDKYNLWRSDLSKTEIINDKQFIEYTKNGYATVFVKVILIFKLLKYTKAIKKDLKQIITSASDPF